MWSQVVCSSGSAHACLAERFTHLRRQYIISCLHPMFRTTDHVSERGVSFHAFADDMQLYLTLSSQQHGVGHSVT